MKAIVDASALRALCELVRMATEREWPNIILQVVPPSAAGNPPRLAAAGFGGHRSVTSAIACEAEHVAGSAVVNAAAAEKLAKNLPTGRATVRLDGGKVALSAGSRAFSVAVAAKDFPVVPTPVGAPAKLPADPLIRMLQATSFSMTASVDEPTSPKSCMLLRWGAGSISAFTCDGHRSSFATATDDDVPDESGAIMIPQVGIKVVESVADGAELISVWSSADRAFFRNGMTRSHVQLTGAAFPTGILVTPRPSDDAASVSRAALLDELGAILAVEPEKGCAVEIGAGALVLSTRATGASGRCSVAASYSGPTLNHWVNPRYLREAVSAIRTEEVSIQWLPRAEQPEYADAVIRAEPDDGSYYVLCPITPPATGR